VGLQLTALCQSNIQTSIYHSKQQQSKGAPGIIASSSLTPLTSVDGPAHVALRQASLIETREADCFDHSAQLPSTSNPGLHTPERYRIAKRPSTYNSPSELSPMLNRTMFAEASIHGQWGDHASPSRKRARLRLARTDPRSKVLDLQNGKPSKAVIIGPTSRRRAPL
jgi:hypothetical protein